MHENAQKMDQQSCFHSSYEVLLDGRLHFLHVITRTEEKKEKKLYFLIDYYGWAVDGCQKLEEAKRMLGIKD